MNTRKYNKLCNAILNEARKACPQMEYVDNPNGREVYKGVLSGIRRYCSKTIPFPSRQLIEREKSAAAEITFHLNKKNKTQILHEVADLSEFFIDELMNHGENETNKGGFDDEELPF